MLSAPRDPLRFSDEMKGFTQCFKEKENRSHVGVSLIIRFGNYIFDLGASLVANDERRQDWYLETN